MIQQRRLVYIDAGIDLMLRTPFFIALARHKDSWPASSQISDAEPLASEMP